MSAPVIAIQHLYKVYRVGAEKVIALDNINLTVPRGQVCCIVGTSGSGKSTLLNLLAGLEKPTSGRVLIGGKTISAFSENQLARFRQKNIGFIFQSYNLIPTMTALENVSLPLIFRGVSRGKRDRAAKRILGEVDLLSRMRHRPNQMSGGQQQRVGIARAFVAKPKIIFADEPTGNLDTSTTYEVMRMMVRLAHENDQTLVIVTHDNEIAAYADRIVTLRDGKIIYDRLNGALPEEGPMVNGPDGLVPQGEPGLDLPEVPDRPDECQAEPGAADAAQVEGPAKSGGRGKGTEKAGSGLPAPGAEDGPRDAAAGRKESPEGGTKEKGEAQRGDQEGNGKGDNQ